MNPAAKCETCSYWEKQRAANDGYDGFCLYAPPVPVVVNGQVVPVWPKTLKGNRCGQWDSKELPNAKD